MYQTWILDLLCGALLRLIRAVTSTLARSHLAISHAYYVLSECFAVVTNADLHPTATL